MVLLHCKTVLETVIENKKEMHIEGNLNIHIEKYYFKMENYKIQLCRYLLNLKT